MITARRSNTRKTQQTCSSTTFFLEL